MDQHPILKGCHRHLYLGTRGQPTLMVMVRCSHQQCGHRRKTSPTALQSLSLRSWGQRCCLYCSTEMMVQVAGCVHAVKEQLVQFCLLFTTSLMEVITISDLLTELLMGTLPKPLLSKEILLAKNQELGYLRKCGSSCLGSLADNHTLSRSKGIKIFRGGQ